MKFTIPAFFLFFLMVTAHAQDCSFLDSKNGFRHIKLGSKASEYPEFQQKTETNLELFKLSFNFRTTHVYQGSDSDKLASAKILFIYLIAENDLITEIRIVTQKVLGVYSTLEAAYGEPTRKQGAKLTWTTDKVECSIEGDDNIHWPGYHIRYRDVSEDMPELKKMKGEQKTKARSEL